MTMCDAVDYLSEKRHCFFLSQTTRLFDQLKQIAVFGILKHHKQILSSFEHLQKSDYILVANS